MSETPNSKGLPHVSKESEMAFLGGRSDTHAADMRWALPMCLRTFIPILLMPGSGQCSPMGQLRLRELAHRPQLVVRWEGEAAAEVDPGLNVLLTCLVATSDRLRRVQRQFCTRRGLLLVRCLPRACIPPAMGDRGHISHREA